MPAARRLLAGGVIVTTHYSKSVRAAAFLSVTAALSAAPAASARVLLVDDGVTVSMDRDLRCGQPVEVEISADRAELFAAGSSRLQGLVDATRAMLGYECRQIPEIRVNGTLRGHRDRRYEGIASAASDWRLVGSGAYAAASPPAGGSQNLPWSPPPPAPRSEPAAPASAPPASGAGRYSVRDLTTGMSVDASMDQARRSFDTAPQYDARRRELTVVRGQCDVSAEARPKAGWVCLKSQFTGDTDPRSYRLSYAQVVDRDQGDAIAAQLRQRFGEPTVDEQERSASWLQGGAPDRRLAWGRVARHELEARVRVDQGVTVLTLDLVDMGLLAEEPRYQVRF